MAISVTVGSLMFPTISKAINFYKGIRDQYENGECISETHQKYLIDLVAIHHDSKVKVGRGISHFTVELDSEFRRTRHFMIHRKDGSQTDVSFHSAIKGPNRRRDLLEALRRAVEDQIVNFKLNEFSLELELTCPLTGEVLDFKNCHVHHESPMTFIRLVGKWLKQESLDLNEVEITPSEDNQIVNKMTNQSQLESWEQFHKEASTLRLLSKLGNLSVAKLR